MHNDSLSRRNKQQSPPQRTSSQEIRRVLQNERLTATLEGRCVPISYESCNSCDSVRQYGEVLGLVLKYCVPTGDSEKAVDMAVFQLTRHLRSYGVELQDAGLIVEEWLRRSRLDLSFEVCMGMVKDGWDKVKILVGDGYLNQILDSARHAPPIPELANCSDPRVVLVGKICRELQSATLPQAFYLSSYKLAELLGTTQRKAYRTLRALIHLGVLRFAERGCGATMKANSYEWKGQ